MDRRTRTYLQGRFGDYYRRNRVESPPDPLTREWGYVPWTAGPEMTMVRHHGLQTERDLDDLLTGERPRHVYYSAGRYDRPDAGTMDSKGWRGSDLIFDLDADHLPGIDPTTDSPEAMLEACKGELRRLLSLLQEDFGITDPTVIFSGGRGYHVHVRDDSYRSLGRESRRDLVDYIQGHGVELETVLETELVAGAGRATPAGKRTLASGGWGRRVHDQLLDFLDSLREMEPDEAMLALEDIDGIGTSRAAAILTVIDERYDELRAGNVDVHPALMTLLNALVPETISDASAAIDEPVTTDIHRLIRLPGSLHGGSGLRVLPIAVEQLDAFNPFTDAIAPTFRDQRITIEVTDPGPIPVGDTYPVIDAGTAVVPEYIGIYLLCTGRARKVREPPRRRR